MGFRRRLGNIGGGGYVLCTALRGVGDCGLGLLNPWLHVWLAEFVPLRNCAGRERT